MVHYRLHYFNSRGYGETARTLFHLAGVEFEDKRYEIEEWIELKTNDSHGMPFGQMPVLEVDGLKIPQSLALTRYLANKFGYAGKTDEEKAIVDAFGDLYKDFQSDIRSWGMVAFGYPGAVGDRDELKKTVFLPGREKYFKILETHMKKSKSGFIADSGLTWPDLFFMETGITFNSIEPGFLGSDFPEVSAYFDRIQNLPKVKEYIEKRPYSER